MKSTKRKRLIIDRKFQFTAVGTHLLAVLISLLIFTGVTAGFYWFAGMSGENLFSEYLTIHRQVTEEQEVEIGGRMETRMISATREIPGVKRWELILPSIVINNLILLVVISIIGVVHTHRMAGPLYRIRMDLSRVLDGEAGVNIVIRKKDRLGDLVDLLNKLIKERDYLKEDNNAT